MTRRRPSLAVTLTDYKNASDSLNQRMIWKLLEHYKIPAKIAMLIMTLYDRTTCRIIDGGALTESFKVETAMWQGCLLSPFLFLLADD